MRWLEDYTLGLVIVLVHATVMGRRQRHAQLARAQARRGAMCD